MGLTARHFLFDEDGNFYQLSQKLHDELVWDDSRLSQFANQELRLLTLLVRKHGRELKEVAEHHASYMRADENGAFYEHRGQPLNPAATRFLEVPDDDEDQPRNVVSIDQIRREQVWTERYRWQPTDREITIAINAVWPETAKKPYKRPPYVKGTKTPK